MAMGMLFTCCAHESIVSMPSYQCICDHLFARGSRSCGEGERRALFARRTGRKERLPGAAVARDKHEQPKLRVLRMAHGAWLSTMV